MKYDVVIVGAGLGGLETAYILAKHGKSVCVLEKGIVAGGCLQPFKRKGHTFDTGFHYVGGMGEGESLRRIFDYFNVGELPWHRLDDDCFDEVIYKGKKFQFASGHENFIERLSDDFPHEKDNIAKYTNFLKAVGDNIFNQFKPKDTVDFYGASLFARGAYDFLKETFSDEDLINVVSGTSLKMELKKESLPLYTFAQINDSFIRSAYRLKGGGETLIGKLCEHIKVMGGEVRMNSEVEELVEENGVIVRARLSSGEEIEGETFISNLHPAMTLELVKQSEKIRKIYRNRISGLQNTMGMFTVNIKLKENALPYLNRNRYIYETEDVWSVADNLGETNSCLVSYQVPEKGESAENVDLLVPMSWSEVEKWNGTKVMRRGEEYVRMKDEKAKECIEFASKYVDGLKEAVEEVYTSTPLTYKDYVNTPLGSAYGIRKDFNKVMQTILTPRTPIENLLLTGQSLNLHGILGVSMTSFFTAAEVIGMDSATEGLNMD